MRKNWHKKIDAKLLRKKYIFAMWYVCDSCKYIQHLEKYKISIELDNQNDLFTVDNLIS